MFRKKATAPAPTMKRSGVVCKTLEDVERALRLFNGETGYVEDSTETNRVQNDALGRGSGGAMAVGVFMLAGAHAAERRGDMVTKMIETARANERVRIEDGATIYHKHFDYDAMGTNFFKTIIEIQRFGAEYLLQINQAYVEIGEAEKNLAKKLGFRLLRI
jgi:hypothetical protein